MNLLEKHFDLAFAAPDGVQKLRELILTLAVQGKLVPQEPKDESASELLTQLRQARLAMYENSHKNNPETKTMLRKLGNLGEVVAPFNIPKTWVTVHLIDCCEYLVDCHNKTATYKESGIPIIRTTNIRDRQIRYQEMKYVDEDTYEFWARRCPPQPGDIIFTREAPMGEAAIIPENMICCLGQRTMLIRPMQKFVYNRYLLIALTEPHLLERASSSAIGSTVKHLRVGDVEELNIPLPPLAEQHRIVAKIDRLMARCDELEKLRAERNQKRITIHTATLNRLLSSSSSSSLPRRRESSQVDSRLHGNDGDFVESSQVDSRLHGNDTEFVESSQVDSRLHGNDTEFAESSQLDSRLHGNDTEFVESSQVDSRLHGNDGEFAEAWRFITQHFGELYSVKENVAELRKAILQLAVMGKLVPQDPKDEPASELLRAIELEKKGLVKEEKIKQSKPLPEIKPQQIPYKLPKGWKWVRVIDVVDVGTGSTPTTTNSEYYNGDIPWYTSSSTNNSVAEKPEKFITEKAIKETNCKIFPSGSLIIALYGQGKTRGQISEIVIPGATNQAIAAMVFYESSKETKQYIKYYFVKIYDEIRSLAEGAAQPNLNVGKIKETLVPLPPLAEQRRIVAKIDQLMALCDRLDQQIDAATSKQTTLLNAVMAQV